jgi:hypothetical protein
VLVLTVPYSIELRIFSRSALLRELEAAGFRDVRISDEPVPFCGVRWAVPWGCR